MWFGHLRVHPLLVEPNTRLRLPPTDRLPNHRLFRRACKHIQCQSMTLTTIYFEVDGKKLIRCSVWPSPRPCCTHLTPALYIFTGRNEVVAKVMFSQECVCPQGGRVSASVHAGMPTPPGADNPPGPGRPPQTRQNPPDQADPPWDQADNPPRPGRHPPDQADTPQTRQTPPGPGRPHPLGSRLQHTVYERPVRILLECILVCKFYERQVTSKWNYGSPLNEDRIYCDFIFAKTKGIANERQ